MARDCVALMRALGHERSPSPATTAAATWRSGRRSTIPARVTRLAVLDAVPIVEALDRCDARFAAAWWHWFFLGQTDKPAERVITADPDAWYRPAPSRWARRRYADFRARDPRPGDGARDVRGLPRGPGSTARTTRPTGRRPARRVPALFLWSTRDDMEDLTATRWRSGGPGRPTSRRARSTAATTWPRRLPTSWPRAADLAGALIAATTPRSARRPPDRRRRSRSRRSARPGTGTRATGATRARGGRASRD